MTALFLRFVSVAVSLVWWILAVMALRVFLKKAPRWITLCLWGVVGVRMLLPVTVSDIERRFPSAAAKIGGFFAAKLPDITRSVTAVHTFVKTAVLSLFQNSRVALICAIVWLSVAAALLLYAVLALIFTRNIKADEIKSGIFTGENIKYPLLVGIFRPKIYLPKNLKGEERRWVLMHEAAHILRQDTLWKTVCVVLVCVFWFSPLSWVAYFLVCRDIEYTCDEKVLFKAGISEPYFAALSGQKAPVWMLLTDPLAIGEIGIKDRVTSLLFTKKLIYRICAAVLLIGSAVALCFVTEPAQTGTGDDFSFVTADSGKEGVGISLSALMQKDGRTVLSLAWQNDTDDTVTLSGRFALSTVDGDTVTPLSPKENAVFSEKAVTLRRGRHKTVRYILSDAFDVAIGQNYRMETEYESGGASYKATADFSRQSSMAAAYEKKDLLFGIGQQITSTDLRPCLVDTDLSFWQKDGNWKPVGTLSPLELTKENFENYFPAGQWSGTDAATLRRQNKRAWAYESVMLLEQQDGTVIFGQRKNDETAYFTLLFRLERTDVSLPLGFTTADAVGGMHLKLLLTGDREFALTFAAGRTVKGTYELTDKTLVLFSEDGQDIYLLDVTENGYAWNEKRSSPLTAAGIKPLPMKNGLLFAADAAPKTARTKLPVAPTDGKVRRYIYRGKTTGLRPILEIDTEQKTFVYSVDGKAVLDGTVQTKDKEVLCISGDKTYRFTDHTTSLVVITAPTAAAPDGAVLTPKRDDHFTLADHIRT